MESNFREVHEKLHQYQSIRENDFIKDFHTAIPQKFVQFCYQLTKVLNIEALKHIEINNGLLIFAEEIVDNKRHTQKKIPTLLKILRSPEVVNLEQVREFNDILQENEINTGYFITSSYFTHIAIKYAESYAIELIDSKYLSVLLRKANELEQLKT